MASAIDQDDAVAVRALYAEGPDSLSGLLERALNKKSCKGMKFPLQVLPTEANPSFKTLYARMAMCLAAEKGDEELASLVVAMGADLDPKRPNQSSLNSGETSS